MTPKENHPTAGFREGEALGSFPQNHHCRPKVWGLAGWYNPLTHSLSLWTLYFWSTIIVVNQSSDFVWPVHSGSEVANVRTMVGFT